MTVILLFSRELCNNHLPRCDIAWLRIHATNHLYYGFPWLKWLNNLMLHSRLLNLTWGKLWYMLHRTSKFLWNFNVCFESDNWIIGYSSHHLPPPFPLIMPDFKYTDHLWNLKTLHWNYRTFLFTKEIWHFNERNNFHFKIMRQK